MSVEKPAGLVIQIAPNDHPPFNDICRTYTLALESLGLTVRTFFLSAPFDSVAHDSIYLNFEDLNDSGNVGRALADRMSASAPILAICHRYRAYRILRSSRVSIPRVVTVAHEFGFFKRFQRRLERRLFAGDQLFAGVSPAVQAELGGVVADPLCIPNAMDLQTFQSDLLTRDAALEALGVTSSPQFTIGLVGRLVEKKDPKLALAALRALVAKGEDVRMLVMGDGPLNAELVSLAGDLPVTFCGFVPDVRRTFPALDAMLLTSREVEAFGMVALEAMASGIPVVSGPSPGPQFVLGSAGYYYTSRDPENVAEAVRRVRDDLASGSLGERLDRGRQRALREFSISALARHLDDLFFRGAVSVQ